MRALAFPLFLIAVAMTMLLVVLADHKPPISEIENYIAQH